MRVESSCFYQWVTGAPPTTTTVYPPLYLWLHLQQHILSHYIKNKKSIVNKKADVLFMGAVTNHQLHPNWCCGDQLAWSSMASDPSAMFLSSTLHKEDLRKKPLDLWLWGQELSSTHNTSMNLFTFPSSSPNPPYRPSPSGEYPSREHAWHWQADHRSFCSYAASVPDHCAKERV